MVLILRSPALGNNARRLGGARRNTAPDINTGTVAIDIPPPVFIDEAIISIIEEPQPQITLAVAEQDQDEARVLLEQQAEAATAAMAQGYEEGYQAGQIAGEAEGRAAYVDALTQLDKLAQNLGHEFGANLVRSEDSMLAMVYSIACKVLGEALSSSEGVRASIAQALTHVKVKEELIIRVHPHDLELIGEGTAFGVASAMQWRADNEVPVGGCLIESVHGTLDARLDTQLEQLKHVLLAERARGTASGNEGRP